MVTAVKIALAERPSGFWPQRTCHLVSHTPSVLCAVDQSAAECIAQQRAYSLHHQCVGAGVGREGGSVRRGLASKEANAPSC